MDETLVRQVLDTARWYPSGENCQPFQFRLKNQLLLVDYVASRARHALVYDDYTVLITLGALLEYLRQAFAQCGAHIAFGFDFADFDALQDQRGICCISLAADAPQPFRSFPRQTLLERVTDRRPFQPPATVALDQEALNARLSYSTCAVHHDADEDFLDFFAECDSLAWASRPIGMDIMSSVSFSDPPADRGLPWRNLGLKKAETLPIRLIQAFPFLFTVFRGLGARKAMIASQRGLWRSSRTFLLFTYREGLAREQKTLANMELMNLWLDLSSQGYGFQPSSFSAEVLNHVLKYQKNLQTETALDLDSQAASIRKMRERLGVGDREVNWVLRCGRPSSPFPPEARTSRLPVSALLAVEG